MIEVVIPAIEYFDEDKEVFVTVNKKPITIKMEHSLISLKKWEIKWKKPFLSKTKKTDEETYDYFRCMCMTPGIDPKLFKYLPDKEIQRIDDYIMDTRSASWFSEDPFFKTGKSRNNEVITAELIYYWMIKFNVPPEYRKWHLNELLQLLQVISIKETPPKKHSTRELLERNSSINERNKRRIAEERARILAEQDSGGQK